MYRGKPQRFEAIGITRDSALASTMNAVWRDGVCDTSVSVEEARPHRVRHERRGALRCLSLQGRTQSHQNGYLTSYLTSFCILISNQTPLYSDVAWLSSEPLAVGPAAVTACMGGYWLAGIFT